MYPLLVDMIIGICKGNGRGLSNPSTPPRRGIREDVLYGSKERCLFVETQLRWSLAVYSRFLNDPIQITLRALCDGYCNDFGDFVAV